MVVHADIIRRAGPAEKVARDRGVSIHTVRSWIQRGRVPAEHWAGFVSDGWATFEELANAVAKDEAA